MPLPALCQWMLQVCCACCVVYQAGTIFKLKALTIFLLENNTCLAYFTLFYIVTILKNMKWSEVGFLSCLFFSLVKTSSLNWLCGLSVGLTYIYGRQSCDLRALEPGASWPHFLGSNFVITKRPETFWNTETNFSPNFGNFGIVWYHKPNIWNTFETHLTFINLNI